MTSFSRLGPVYVSAHQGLITGILHDEWGFNGYVITDMVNPATYMTWKESVIAGTTNFDTNKISEDWASYLTAETNTFSGDATMLKAIKDRVHARSCFFNRKLLRRTEAGWLIRLYKKRLFTENCGKDNNSY